MACNYALVWYITQDKSYARKAIDLLDAWSATLDSVTDGNQKLLVGTAGGKYLNAAEILRYTYKGWKRKDQQSFEKRILTVWYPLLQDFMPGNNGNRDAAT